MVIIILERVQFSFQIRGSPEQGVIEIFPAHGSDQAFYEGMGCRGIGDGFDFLNAQYA